MTINPSSKSKTTQNITSIIMFPFGKSCEISFQFNGSQKDVGVDSDLLAAVNLFMAKAEPKTTTTTTTTNNSYKRKICAREGGWDVKQYGVAGGDKKSLHRNTERQRREVMSGLLNTLYSHLPSQYVKGKRSVTDHIDETINYIKHMQDNIKELQAKRDRITTVKANSTAISPLLGGDSSFSNIPCSVSIFTRNGSLEIQIIDDNKENGFSLSEPLKVLIDQGLDVVCSVSSKANGNFIHNIQCQISDSIDVQKLQQRLYDVVNPSSSSSSVYEAAGTEYSPIEWLEKETQFYSLMNFA